MFASVAVTGCSDGATVPPYGAPIFDTGVVDTAAADTGAAIDTGVASDTTVADTTPVETSTDAGVDTSTKDTGGAVPPYGAPMIDSSTPD